MVYSYEERQMYRAYKEKPRKVIFWPSFSHNTSNGNHTLSVFGFYPKKRGYKKDTFTISHSSDNEAAMYLCGIYEAVKHASTILFPETRYYSDAYIDKLYDMINKQIWIMIQRKETFDLLTDTVRAGVSDEMRKATVENKVVYKYCHCIDWLGTKENIFLRRFGQ